MLKSIEQAVEVYRDSPNTFGHEGSDVKRFELKRLMGLVASQRYLQDAIQDARGNEYTDEGQGMRHLWERLKTAEDSLQEAEERYGEKIMARPRMTIAGKVHAVPSIALGLMKMEAQQL